jgi:hypothetical protein
LSVWTCRELTVLLQKSLASELATKIMPLSLRAIKPTLKRKVGYSDVNVNKAREKLRELHIETDAPASRVDEAWNLD